MNVCIDVEKYITLFNVNEENNNDQLSVVLEPKSQPMRALH